MAIGISSDTDYAERVSIPSGGTGTLTDGAFANTFVGVWLYYLLENSTVGQEAGYIKLSDLATATYIRRANDNAGSQYANELVFGNDTTASFCVFGHYAYARAVYATDALTYAASDATIAGDWGFWPLADNTDTGDDSGNGRTLTFGGTLTSETSPTLGGGGGGDPVGGLLRGKLLGGGILTRGRLVR